MPTGPSMSGPLGWLVVLQGGWGAEMPGERAAGHFVIFGSITNGRQKNMQRKMQEHGSRVSVYVLGHG